MQELLFIYLTIALFLESGGGGGAPASTGSSGGKKGKKGKGAANPGLNDYTVEYAKSGRAKCRGCENNILKVCVFQVLCIPI